ncbi:MAG: LptF/LptG family permease, partial [Candidatus Sericytochromatia bacterium]
IGLPMLLDRYLLREWLGPLGFALVVLGSLMTTGFVLFGLIEDSARFHYPLALMLQIMLLRLPEMLFYTLPMAALLATLLAVARLSADQELLILRIHGMSFWRFGAPFLTASLAIALAAIALNETLVPPSAWLARQLLHQARSGEPLSLPRQEHLLFRDLGPEGLRHLVYARATDGRQLQGVVVQVFERQQLRAVLLAETARYTAGSWLFSHGSLLELRPGSEQILRASFSSYELNLPETLQSLIREARQPLELNLHELAGHIRSLESLGQPVAALQVRWHQKLAIPLAALVFCALGLVLGARTLRSASQGLGLSLMIVFLYYLLMSLGTALGDGAQIPAWLGAWLPHLITLPLAIALMERRNRLA